MSSEQPSPTPAVTQCQHLRTRITNKYVSPANPDLVAEWACSDCGIRLIPTALADSATGPLPHKPTYRTIGTFGTWECSCGEFFAPDALDAYAAHLSATGPLDVDALNTAILDELAELWGEPSDAVSKSVRPQLANSIAARYARLASQSSGATDE